MPVVYYKQSSTDSYILFVTSTFTYIIVIFNCSYIDIVLKSCTQVTISLTNHKYTVNSLCIAISIEQKQRFKLNTQCRLTRLYYSCTSQTFFFCFFTEWDNLRKGTSIENYARCIVEEHISRDGSAVFKANASEAHISAVAEFNIVICPCFTREVSTG